jgi:hypothetical protein
MITPGRVQPFTPAPTPAAIRWVVGRDLNPSPDEYQAILAALWVGDSAMDAFIRAAQDSGKAAAQWAVFRDLQAGRVRPDEVTLPELQHLWAEADRKSDV